MASGMKTTIDIGDDLAIRAKRLARERGTTFRALVEEGLRHELEAMSAKTSFKLKDKRGQGKGLQAELQGKRWTEIEEEIYKGRGA